MVMKNEQFTPGPWKVDFETEELQTNNLVLGLIYGCSHDDSPDCIANANLIAAAPDMYEALKEVLGDGGIGWLNPDTRDSIRLALSKANPQSV